MKKNYVSPLANEVNVTTEGLIAASLKMNNTTVDSRTQQLSNENRGEWGNLWGK